MLLASLVVAIGYVALGWALTYLAVATRARRREFPKLLLYVPLIAGVLQALATRDVRVRDQRRDQRLPRRLAHGRRGPGRHRQRPRRVRLAARACPARSGSRWRSC